MIYDFSERWRALHAWFEDFAPDDQERLIGHLEYLMVMAKDRDMGAFIAMVDELVAFIKRIEAEIEQTSKWANTSGLSTPDES
jgi:hypothetical protein